jgi:hypothetical protein
VLTCYVLTCDVRRARCCCATCDLRTPQPDSRKESPALPYRVRSAGNSRRRGAGHLVGRCCALAVAGAGNWQPETGNWQLTATGNWQLETGNRQLTATGNWQPETGNWQLETGNRQLATGNWQLATRSEQIGLAARGFSPAAPAHRVPAHSGCCGQIRARAESARCESKGTPTLWPDRENARHFSSRGDVGTPFAKGGQLFHAPVHVTSIHAAKISRLALTDAPGRATLLSLPNIGPRLHRVRRFSAALVLCPPVAIGSSIDIRGVPVSAAACSGPLSGHLHRLLVRVELDSVRARGVSRTRER